MQPDEENNVEHGADNHADDVVAGGPRLGNRDQPPLLAALGGNAVIDGVSEERGEENDGGEIAVCCLLYTSPSPRDRS